MNIIKKMRPLYWRFPRLRPLLLGAYHVINPNYIKFIGWGMSTTHALPWDDSFNQTFKKSLYQIKEDFNFKDKTLGTITEEHLDTLAYRHWYISFATQYVLTFLDSENC